MPPARRRRHPGPTSPHSGNRNERASSESRGAGTTRVGIFASKLLMSTRPVRPKIIRRIYRIMLPVLLFGLIYQLVYAAWQGAPLYSVVAATRGYELSAR